MKGPALPDAVLEQAAEAIVLFLHGNSRRNRHHTTPRKDSIMRSGKELAVFMVSWLAVTFAASSAALAQMTADTRPKIATSGEAVVYAEPDRIVISLGVETWDAQAEAAKRKNDEIVKRTIAAILKCGLDKKAIQTDNITIEPTYKTNEENRPRNIDGYCVRNSLTVTLEKVKLVDRVIMQALASGVNRINSVDFQVTELRKYRDKARRLALKAAREKAQNMAEVYGQTVGKPLQIDEGGYWCGGSSRDLDLPVPQYAANAATLAPNVSGSDIGETVALGKIGIRANVNVVFELKDK